MIQGTAPAQKRRGFTLLETIIVLGILLALVSLSWPTMRDQLSRSRLQNAAKDIRSQLARARIEAMETGVAQQFRYQQGGEAYEISPLELTDMVADPVSLLPSFAPGQIEIESHEVMGDEMTSDTDSESIQHKLPENISFSDSSLTDVNEDLLSQPVELIDSEIEHPETTEEIIETDESAVTNFMPETSWSEPIIFQPNGRTSDARIRLRGSDRASIEINLRGLTGTATVGKMRREETLP